jgi:hypothetical protein
MKAIEELRYLQHDGQEARRLKQLRRAFKAALQGWALVSFARMPRRRRLAFAAAEAIFADRAHRALRSSRSRA